MDFLAKIIGGRFSVAFAEKHTGKNSVETFGENIPFFGAFFGAFFGTFVGAFFGEQLFRLEIRKIRAESVLQERPLKTKRPCSLRLRETKNLRVNSQYLDCETTSSLLSRC